MLLDLLVLSAFLLHLLCIEMHCVHRVWFVCMGVHVYSTCIVCVYG